MVGKVKFEARIKELVENQRDLAELVEPLLIVLRALREQMTGGRCFVLDDNKHSGKLSQLGARSSSI